MKSTILLLLIICLGTAVYGQKTSKQNKSKEKTEANQNGLDEEVQYSKLIAVADKYFAEKNYAKAKEYYSRATLLKPSDPYPEQKLVEIEALLRAQKAQVEKMLVINQLIKEGDELFALKRYSEAKTKYNEVIALDATAYYPKQKLTEIQNLLAPSDSPGQFNKVKSDSIMSIADSLFAYKQYNIAKVKYSEVLKLQPNDIHAQERITEINRICETDGCGGDQKKMEYDKCIAEADAFLKMKDYQKAKSSYLKAVSINASAAYPKQRLYEIEQMQAEQAKMSTYNGLIAKADKLLLSKQYLEAKNTYSEAIAVKPDASYPKQKIVEIEKLLSEKEE